MLVRRVDPPQQPPGFFLRFWLFFVKLAHSFTGLFKSKAHSATLPIPVTAGSQIARQKPPPVPRRLELVDTMLSNRRSPQRSSQKKGFSSQSPAVYMAAEIHQDTLCRNGTDTQNEDLRTKKHEISYFPGFIGRTVSPGRVPEGGALRTATSLRTSAQPLDRDLRRCNSVMPVVADIWNPALVPSSPLPSRRLSLRVTSITNGSILSLGPVNPRLAAMHRSTGPRLRISSSAKPTQVSASESVHSIAASPFAIRRGFAGASVRTPPSSIRLQSPWSPLDKTLPHDVWMNSEGVLANVRGPVYASLDDTKSSQDDVIVLQHGPYTQLPCAPSSRFSDDGDDFISIYSNIFDLPEEEKYEEEESSKGTSQGDSFTANGTDKGSPPGGAAAGSVMTIPVDDSAAIKRDAIQNFAEDVEFEDSNKSNTSSGFEEGFFCVVSQSKFDLASDDHTSGLAYIPSLKNREVRPLSVVIEPVDHPDRTTKRFSVPCLHSVREFDQSPLRTSTSDSSPSKHFPAAESRSLRALADLISLLDFAAMEAVEADGVPEIGVGEPRLVRAD
ncbi:hypothetical protein DEU56DRAFT_831191 [Suillus clintonianus]|uniref:uncharacterized protein n=1 Tax=Suillus clintonianus TaxID=1904413 RepID=UPI001B876860|nr:uncharacterized protein DEU56DRAFT_831191 [Suillus clintonianus]KAG2122758.1 hypothetical protein DEU56DRAFT_831191 [Suillus clintonianus]